MQRSIPTLLLALVALSAPLMVKAAPTVNFQGEVSAQTCTAIINGQSDSVVLLPTVSTTSLASPGATSGLTPFSISVTGCTPPETTLPIKTVFLGHNVTSAGNLGNTGTASNVSIQLTSSAAGDTPVKLNGATPVAGLELEAGNSSASYEFGVQYVNDGTGEAGAGSVQAVAEYTLSYL